MSSIVCSYKSYMLFLFLPIFFLSDCDPGVIVCYISNVFWKDMKLLVAIEFYDSKYRLSIKSEHIRGCL